jgi:predicted AlkP superfamily phosphohydrolase/phosphomutase
MSDAAGVLFVGLDACDLDVAQRLAAAGRMPNLAHLLRHAAVAETRAPIGVFVSSIYPTFATGLSPATYDYHCWVAFERGGYELHPTLPDEVQSPPLWRQLSAAGRRTAVFDVPHFPVEEIDGAMVAEWGCHDRHFGTASYPHTLVDEIDERFGPHPVGTLTGSQFAPCDYSPRRGDRRSRGEQQELWTNLLVGQQRKTDASLHLLDQGGWDVFLTVHGEAHCTGHQFFHLHQRCHPRHDPVLRALMGDPIAQMYERLDASVGAHLERAGDDTTVYVNLSHGMQAHHDGDHLLDQILFRMALFDGSSATPGWRTRVANAAMAQLSSERARSAGRLAAPLVRRRMRAAPPAPNPDLPPRETRPWYQCPNNTVTSGIRLNTVGREYAGLIEPGAEFGRHCEQLATWLHELVNVDTGEPVVLDVVRTDAHYDCKPDAVFPDLFVEWNHNAPIERVWSPRLGTIYGPYTHWRTGDHHRRGLLLATGPGIRPGRRDEPVDTIDLSATIAASAGVALDDIEGRPVEHLVGSP